MPIKNKFSKFFLIFLISSALFFTVKVYFFREELKLFSNGQNIEFCEVNNLKTFFGLEDSIQHGSFQRGYTVEYNVPKINITAKIKNLTNEDIEDAYLYPELKIKFEYGEKILTAVDSKITYDVKMWKSNETLDFKHDFILFDHSSGDGSAYDNKFMKHRPKEIILNIYVKASNSVGFNKDELVFSKEIKSWDIN
jgi:hypothetical protein